MTQNDRYNMLLKVNFGDIDGMYDPNLTEYFVDREYWERIINNNKYFVIGRKGTGKSALYKWINTKSSENGDLCSNRLFNEFPLKQLFNLKDDSFLMPNQYQTICRNMILSEFARLIVIDAERIENDFYKQIEYYYINMVGNSIEDCFRETVKRTMKEEGQLMLKCASAAKSQETEQLFSFTKSDLASVNNVLENAILSYFKIYTNKKKFILQVDGIDENYTQLAREQNTLDDYFQFIICLMKSTYTLNQKIHSECCDVAKCIVYLRSDIFFNIHKIDAESARWEQNAFYLNWAINSKSGWENNDLRKLINARISNSYNISSFSDAFNCLFDPEEINLTIKKYNQKTKKRYFPRVNNIFEYIVLRTFYRPRDVVQFCIKIQEAARKLGELSYKTFRDAEREYSLWFLSEITNEMSPNVQGIEELFTMLRSLGSNPLSISTFKKKYEKYEKNIGMEANAMLKYLYNLAIIYNINDNGEVFSSIRNDRSTLNQDIKICLHPGFWMGLYVSTF